MRATDPIIAINQPEPDAMPAIPIPSPYNFVTLSDRVFFPDWAEQVSQDVPFSDGISGWFSIEVTAMTPIFIRQGEKPVVWHKDYPQKVMQLRDRWIGITKPANDRLPEDDWIEFLRLTDGNCAIPGTSIKGVIRTIVEIASFGKLSLTNGNRVLKGDQKKLWMAILQKDIQQRTQKPDQLVGRLDLAETIFGKAEEQESIRGRVNFEALPLNRMSESPRHVIWPVMQTPKGKFAPNYVEQPHVTDACEGSTDTFIDYENKKACLRGWKLYPRSLNVRHCTMPPADNHSGRVRWELSSPMRPLSSGTQFVGRVHIHNLREKEFGALLWAIGLGEKVESTDNRRFWHGIGAAKPFGYGSVTIRVLPEHRLAFVAKSDPVNFEKCIRVFEAMMNSFHSLEKPWIESIQLRQLHRISNPNTRWPMDLAYPTFADFKAYADETDVRHILLDASRSRTVSPPKPLPDLIGHLRQVSFDCETESSDKGRSTRHLWFGLKVDKDKFRAVLRNPTSPQLSGSLRKGDSHKLWVVGMEGDRDDRYYILAEKKPETSADMELKE